MRVQMFYRENTDYARAVIDFLRDFEHQTGHKLETFNPDTIRGEQLCSAYDIVEYPTILVTSDDGAMLKIWNGLPLPTIMDLSYYVQ